MTPASLKRTRIYEKTQESIAAHYEEIVKDLKTLSEQLDPEWILVLTENGTIEFQHKDIIPGKIFEDK